MISPGIPSSGRAFAVGLLILALLPWSARGGDKNVAQAEAPAPWQASLATGWDSLYMFRGANQLPGYRGYGSGISWTGLTLTASPTPQDSFSITSWAAFGIDDSDYQEIDGSATYTRTIGDLSLSAGYALYTVLSAPGGQYSNELTASAAYEFRAGSVKITPGLEYAYTLGPDPGNGGYIPSDAGYLQLRVDGDLPIGGKAVSLAPWIAEGFSFGYNTTETSFGDTPAFTGADHLELGLSLPIAVTEAIAIAPYMAYSRAWVPLTGTKPDTVWGGISVTFSF